MESESDIPVMLTSEAQTYVRSIPCPVFLVLVGKDVTTLPHCLGECFNKHSVAFELMSILSI